MVSLEKSREMLDDREKSSFNSMYDFMEKIVVYSTASLDKERRFNMRQWNVFSTRRKMIMVENMNIYHLHFSTYSLIR